MLERFVQSLMNVAGVVVEWFTPPGEPRFGLIQMGVALLLMTVVIAVLAFWRRGRSRRSQDSDDARL